MQGFYDCNENVIAYWLYFWYNSQRIKCESWLYHMKKHPACCLLAAMIMLTACAADSENAVSEAPIQNSAPININDAPMPAAQTDEVTPFSDYTFELKGAKENYMVILSKGTYENEIKLAVENNLYKSKEFVITAPDGYLPSFPMDAQYASSAVKIISNDIDETYIPDIMQFRFYLSDFSDENAAMSVSRMYMIDKKGELREIEIVSEDDGSSVTYDYLDKTQLSHCEADKFIYEIIVDDKNIYDDNGALIPIEQRVKIKTLTFEYLSSPKLVIGQEEISTENPLYFGYAYWSAANSAAQYFTMNTFNISNWENYIETKLSDGSSVYYFEIDDARFSCVNDLHSYLNTIFTESAAARIFNDAPQKYTDIDDKLYGIAGDGGYDSSLGALTFTDMEISENKMLFRSRQEKYDQSGNFTGYTDGGNFLIAKQNDGNWKVIQYRYPYSL